MHSLSVICDILLYQVCMTCYVLACVLTTADGLDRFDNNNILIITTVMIILHSANRTQPDTHLEREQTWLLWLGKLSRFCPTLVAWPWPNWPRNQIVKVEHTGAPKQIKPSFCLVCMLPHCPCQARSILVSVVRHTIAALSYSARRSLAHCHSRSLHVLHWLHQSNAKVPITSHVQCDMPC